jgi:dihydroflavonol-4-reductase
MKVLVTGATGFIGFHVVRFLREKGLHVRALVRQDTDDSGVRSLDAETVRGDVRDLPSVMIALRGCSHVYHVAADYRLWVPDPRHMYETNVEGTKNVLEAALMLGVEKVVYTSTVGVLTGASNGRPADEGSTACIEDMVGHYKRSKFLAEQETYGFIEKGVPVVIVNPSTPIGEMDRKPTPTGKMIVDFLNGRIPAYIDTGLNFIDVEDVAAGHWLAAAKGRTGERYILGNKNITLRDFFETLALIAGRKPPRIRLPYLPVLLAAHIDEAVSKWVTHRPPAIPVTGVRMAGKFMYFDASKAVAELQLPQTPVERAMEKAVDWYRKHGYAKS